MSQHDKTSSKNLRSYLNSILLVPGIICLIIGIIDETKVGRVSLILGCLSLIGSYLSSYPLYQQLRKIQSKMGIELVVDYPGKVHELYSKASSSDVIYCCTSSWIVTEKLHRTLLEVKSMESYFVGPIVSDQQLYGALFRKWISDVRVAQSKTGFVILHRQESTTKFVLVGNSLVLSSANWQEESKEGFLYTEVSIAKTYREFFREIIIENTLQLEELVFNTFCSLVKKEGPLKLLVDKIAKNQKGSMFFSEAEIEETLTGIFRSLEDKGKVVLREDDKQTIIEVLVNDNHFAMNHIPSDRQKLPAVRVILNNKCNFDCFYCPDSNENYSGTPKTYLKPLDVKWIVETLIENHFTAFRLTGGEPTLLPRSYQSILSDLVRNNQDIEFKLATNGYDLNDVLDLYSDLSTNFTLKVSLDSIDFEKARKIANRKNINVNRVKESISEAVRRGISVGINSVITKSNADEIQDLIRFSLEEKVYLKLLDLDWYPDLKVTNQSRI
jgi:sulfatase maturation enzyme AslB (radical SAM superfamily)